MKEITLDNITKEDIIAMAQYIQQMEQLNKDQKGYILQLQKQLSNAGKRLSEFHKMYNVKPPIVVNPNDVNSFVEIEGKLEL